MFAKYGTVPLCTSAKRPCTLGVGEADPADRRTAHVGKHRGRLDPLGGGAEKMAIVRRRGAPLHLQGIAIVRR
jgi:hypothetical protein